MGYVTKDMQRAVNAVIVWERIAMCDADYRNQYRAAASVDHCAHVAEYANEQLHFSIRTLAQYRGEARRFNLIQH